MKKILISTLVACIGTLPSVYAQNATGPWIDVNEDCTEQNAQEILVGEQVFQKPEGNYKLCVKQRIMKRTIETIDETVTQDYLNGRYQGCYSRYFVNGKPWDSSHPDWNKPNVRISKKNGCEVERDDIPNPNAMYEDWKVNSKVYNYDSTPPSCGTPYFYERNLMSYTPTEYQGGWTNKKLSVRFTCEDPLSGCMLSTTGKQGNPFQSLLNRIWNQEDTMSDYVPLVHNTQTEIQVTLGDAVSNRTSMKCSLNGFPTYKFDEIQPLVDVEIAGKKIEKTKDNDILHLLANKETKIHLDILDTQSKEVKERGISGIKTVSVRSMIGHQLVSCDGGEKEFSSPNSNESEPQRKEIEVKCDYQKAGKYALYIDVEDHAGNKVTRQKTITVHPNNAVSLIAETMHSDGDKWANHKDEYSFNLSVKDEYDNPVIDKSVPFILPQGISLQEGNPKSESALDINSHNLKKETDQNGSLGTFSVSSYAPGIMNGNFQAKLKPWNEKYEDNGDYRQISTRNKVEEGYKFLPLYKAKMDFADGDTEIIFGQKQALQFTFERSSVGGDIQSPQVTTDAFDGVEYSPKDSWKITSTGAVQHVFPRNGGIIKRDFIAEQLQKIVVETGKKGVEIFSKPRVSYRIDGKDVSYHVGQEYTTPVEPLGKEGGNINKIYIGGQEQSQGKQEFVSDMTKIGNNSWATARNAIARSVAELTRNRKSDGSVVNGVKYITGNKTLSGEVSGEYKTLIVEGGNVTFDGNFNTKKENIAIIVMKKGDESAGNIYIKPNVAFISALIFAEGSIESVNEKGDPFTVSDKKRTEALSKQIVFHGGLYSRNTIGGAVHGADGKYVLPGAVKTDDIHKAVQYDLSFLRMKGEGFDDDNHTRKYNQGRTESVVVWPNTQALSNPPPGFRLQ